eukprot:COSAG02_NODE_32164_length_521_cov_0.732227_1_plen_109_part_10
MKLKLLPLSFEPTGGGDELEEVLLTVPPPREDGLPWRVLIVDSPTAVQGSGSQRRKRPTAIHRPISVVPNEATAQEDDYTVTIPDAANPGDTVRWSPPGTSRRYDFIVP